MQFVYFAKSRSVRIAIVMLVALAIACLGTPLEASQIPLAEERAIVMYDLIPFFVTALWTACAARPTAELEHMLPRALMRRRRLCWHASISLSLCAVAIGSQFIRFGEPYMAHKIVGGALLGMGIATFSAMLFPLFISWAPNLILAIVLWLWGTTDGMATPAVWAVPLYAGYNTIYIGIVAGVWLCSLVAYALGDGKPKN